MDIEKKLSKTEQEKKTKSLTKSLAQPLKRQFLKGNANELELKSSLDNLLKIAIEGLFEDDSKKYDLAVKEIYEIYELSFNTVGYPRKDLGIEPVIIWFNILIRLPIIGGCCIKENKLDLVRDLALKPIPGDKEKYFPSWYRQMFTESARAGLLNTDFLRKSAEYLKENKKIEAILCWELERTISYIAGFDFAAGLFASDKTGQADSSSLTCAFGYHRKEYSESVLKKIIEKRKDLIKSSDERLRLLIKTIYEITSKVTWGWGDWTSQDFLDESVLSFFKKV